MDRAPPSAGAVEARELAAVGQAHRPAPGDGLEDDRECALHHSTDDRLPGEEDAKNLRERRYPRPPDMSISTNQLKSGNHVEVDGTVYKVLEFQHVNPGKGAAFVRTKLRRASDGNVIDKTFRAGEKFRSVRTEVRRLQFLYGDGQDAHFMDTESYEQFAVPESRLADALRSRKASEEVEVLYIDEEPADVQLPSAIDLAVTETEPGLRGDTA